MICHLQCCGSNNFPCHYLTTVKKITPQKIFDRMLGTVSLKLFLFIRSTSDKRLFFFTHISRTHFVSSFTHTFKMAEDCQKSRNRSSNSLLSSFHASRETCTNDSVSLIEFHGFVKLLGSCRTSKVDALVIFVN